MMTDEGGDEPFRRGTAGRHMFEGEVTSAGAASIGLLVGIELGIHEEPMLEIVYADLDRLRISDRTEMAGNLQATFVRFLDRGPHFFTSYMLVCLEGSDAPVRPISHSLARILRPGELPHLETVILAGLPFQKRTGDIQMWARELAGFDGLLEP